jgi:hypothetical protein
MAIRKSRLENMQLNIGNIPAFCALWYNGVRPGYTGRNAASFALRPRILSSSIIKLKTNAIIGENSGEELLQ